MNIRKTIRHTLATTALALGLGSAALACMDNAYFPVTEGGTVTYRTGGMEMTQTFHDVSAGGFSVTMNVEGLEDPVTMDYLCTEDGILAPSMSGIVPGMNMEILEMDGVSYPSDWSVGQTWESTISMEMTMDVEGVSMQSTMTVHTVSTITGTETITVEAGTFDTVVMESTADIRTVTMMMGMSVPMNQSSVSTTWLAEGVGTVRSEAEGSVTELISYSF